MSLVLLELDVPGWSGTKGGLPLLRSGGKKWGGTCKGGARRKRGRETVIRM